MNFSLENGNKKEMIYYYLAREWSSDDDRLKKDLELMGKDLKPLTIKNIFTRLCYVM